MNILVTNDDGINSIGLQKLAIYLKEKGNNVYIYAPDGNRSGASHSMIFRHDLLVKELKIIDGIKSFALSGSPCDCARFGIEECPEKIDLVFSGINFGSNLANDAVYSGTVQAGLEAVFNKVPAIALSNCALKDCDFDSSISIIDEIYDNLISMASIDYCLNVNIPNISKEQIKGYKVCKPGDFFYDDKYIKVGEGIYQLQGDQLNLDKNSDVYYSSLGYVTITPIVSKIFEEKYLLRISGLNKENK